MALALRLAESKWGRDPARGASPGPLLSAEAPPDGASVLTLGTQEAGTPPAGPTSPGTARGRGYWGGAMIAVVETHVNAQRLSTATGEGGVPSEVRLVSRLRC